MKVTLFRFWHYDVGNDAKKVSRRWGTREAIEAVRGNVMEDSRVEIDEPEWDEFPGLTKRDFNMDEALGLGPIRMR